MKYLKKSVKDFDNYEKYVYQMFDCDLESIEDNIDYTYDKVHFKDRWDVFIFTTMHLEEDEYASDLLVIPSFMHSVGNKHRLKCDCAVDTLYKVNGRSYRIIYDCFD